MPAPREVHFRIASPPITHPDYYGIDTPERDKLFAATHDLEEMRAVHRRGLAGLPVGRRHLPRHGLSPAATRRDPQFTDHCFTGEYPTTAHRHDAGGTPAAATVAAGGSELKRPMCRPLERGDRARISQLDELPLASRMALVTGASRGIGYAAARALAEPART